MKTYQIILMLISFLIFNGYLLLVYWKVGIQKDVSTSFYALEKRFKNWKWIFTFAIWGSMFPIAIVGVEITPFFWWAAAFIMFVGAAPAFKQKLTRTVHLIGAIGGIAFSVLAFIVTSPWLAVLCLLAPMGIIKAKNYNNNTWWIETIAYNGSWIGLLILTLIYNGGSY